MEASTGVSYRNQPVAFSCAMNMKCHVSESLAALCHWKGKLWVEMYIQSPEGGGTRWSARYDASKNEISVFCFVRKRKE
jgi:hypothetical protein